MKNFTDILDVLALIVQLKGAILMFYNSPINRVTGTVLGGNYDKVAVDLKNKWLKRGFLILALGVAISIVSLLLKDFYL